MGDGTTIEYTNLRIHVSWSNNISKRLYNKRNKQQNKSGLEKILMFKENSKKHFLRRKYSIRVFYSLWHTVAKLGLTAHNIHKLETYQYDMERSMLNIKLRQKINLETITKQARVTDVTYSIKNTHRIEILLLFEMDRSHDEEQKR